MLRTHIYIVHDSVLSAYATVIAESCIEADAMLQKHLEENLIQYDYFELIGGGEVSKCVILEEFENDW